MDGKLAIRPNDPMADLLDLSSSLVLDLNARILLWTAGCEHLYGYSSHEAVGRVSHELLQTGFSEPLEQILAQVTKTGRWQGELTHRHRDGHLVTVASLWALRRPSAGQPAMILEANNDISELKQTTEALRVSEEKFRAAFESAAVGMAQTDPEGRWLRVNRRLAELLGYSQEELRGRQFTELTHPDDLDEDLRQFYRLMHGEVSRYVLEKRYIRRGGDVIWVRVTRGAHRDPDGQIAYSVSVEDITARKQAEAALDATRRRLAAIIESAMDAIISVDEQQRIILFNPAAEKMFGCSVNEAVGAPLERFIPQRYRPAHAQHMRRFGQTGQTSRSMGHLGAISGVRASGEEFPIEASISQVEVDGRKIFSVILRDRSERQRIEHEMAQSRTALETASRAKDHFLAVLSHELRAPLTPVLATVAMLQEESRWDADAQESLDVIRRNCELEARLIDDLLDVTRIVRGKIELDRHAINLETVLQHAVQVCRPDIEARRLEFGMDIRDGPFFLHADAARLQQVFWNLLKNATKFTPLGGCIGVAARREGDGVVVEVSDSGIGIDADDLSRIFDPFVQAERSVERKFGGLGLGLAISKAMVEMHGGVIQASSAGAGKGATFAVSLPLIPAGEAASVRAHSAEATGRQTRSLRILLVEDHGDTAHVMTRILKRAGHQIEGAGDIATAMKLAGEHEYDLLLSDLGLPDGTGLDLMRALRGQGLTLPGIALSGYGQDQDIAQSREAGFAVHLIKPVSPEQLNDAIASIVGGS